VNFEGKFSNILYRIRFYAYYIVRYSIGVKFILEMDNFDILGFDPLSPRAADTYVQSVIESTKLNKVSTTIAEIHSEKTVSDFNCMYFK